jgi:thioester reductase-like protein
LSQPNPPTVFLTGATGAIGSRVLEHYVESGSPVVALVRSREGLTPQQRLEALLDSAGLPAESRRRATAIEGSIEEKNFGLDRGDRRRVPLGGGHPPGRGGR